MVTYIFLNLTNALKMEGIQKIQNGVFKTLRVLIWPATFICCYVQGFYEHVQREFNVQVTVHRDKFL